MTSCLHALFALLPILFAASCSTVSTHHSAAAVTTKWIVLFDGTSTEAWRGYRQEKFPSKHWKVENRMLTTVLGVGGNDLETKEFFRDFELELEWKISPGGNSGIIYRVSEEYEAPGMAAPEMQVLDDRRHPDGKNPKTTAGALYGLIAPSQTKALKPVGEWNQVRIIVHHSHVEHWLNGIKVVEYEMNSPELNALVSSSKFASYRHFAKTAAGPICLQHHLDAVWYRKIRVRRLLP